ncbi:MAG: MIP/aquaporin family protein [Rhodospirillaceae bacterium]
MSQPEKPYDLTRRLAAEALGTALLLATVVGSGIMGDAMAVGQPGMALLGNTVATGAILVVLILMLGPISGAHFNPAVTLAFLMRQEIIGRDAALYVVVQVIAAVAGTWLAHAMFGLDIVQASQKVRTGGGQWLAETVACFGLVATILTVVKFRADAVAYAVGLCITAGYWFTASTSFANPAVTVARSMTNTFSGIRPADAPGFIAAQIAGAVAATVFMGWLLRGRAERPD